MKGGDGFVGTMFKVQEPIRSVVIFKEKGVPDGLT